jgi:hypothetical protein
MIVETNISYGYVSLLNTFFEANELNVVCEESDKQTTTLKFDDNSDTALKITLMSCRHMGFENMLCDYLINCGVPAPSIPIGKAAVKRDMAELERKWQEHRKTLSYLR